MPTSKFILRMTAIVALLNVAALPQNEISFREAREIILKNNPGLQ